MTARALSGLTEIGLPASWQFAENYLNISNTVEKATSVHDKTILITPATTKTPLIVTILKVVSYITVILPIIAIIISTCYRRRYTIRAVDLTNKPSSSQGTKQPEPSAISMDLPPGPDTKPFDATSYSVQDVIEKVKAASAQGLKTALFIGRVDTHILPKENGWYWISLHESMERAFIEDRPHLLMQFRNMRSITGLFNKVVVDSTGVSLSRFDSPWKDFHKLLVKQPDSELIVSTGPSGVGISNNTSLKDAIYHPQRAFYEVPIWDSLKFYDEETRVFTEWSNLVGAPHVKQRYDKFLNAMTPDQIAEEMRMYQGKDDGLKLRFKRLIIEEEGLTPYDIKIERDAEYLKRVKVCLESLFDNILMRNEEFPYPTHAGKEKKKFWICTSPK